MISGLPAVASSFSSIWKPRATSPYLRAAATTEDARAPSRETPHAIRSCSSGTYWP